MFGVIFDMDGTLLDTQRICVEAWDYAGEIQNISGVGDCLPEVCGMNEPGWTAYLKEHYKTMDTDLFKADIKKYILSHEDIKFKAGAEKLIKYLKQRGVKTAVASGSSKGLIERNFKKLGYENLFDAAIGGDEVNFGKPAPDIFLLAAEKIGVPPEKCFVFEDSANGIKAGFAAGMKCIGIPDIAEFKPEIEKLMFCEIKTLDEAINIFENIEK